VRIVRETLLELFLKKLCFNGARVAASPKLGPICWFGKTFLDADFLLIWKDTL